MLSFRTWSILDSFTCLRETPWLAFWPCESITQCWVRPSERSISRRAKTVGAAMCSQQALSHHILTSCRWQACLTVRVLPVNWSSVHHVKQTTIGLLFVIPCWTTSVDRISPSFFHLTTFAVQRCLTDWRADKSKLSFCNFLSHYQTCTRVLNRQILVLIIQVQVLKNMDLSPTSSHTSLHTTLHNTDILSCNSWHNRQSFSLLIIILTVFHLWACNVTTTNHPIMSIIYCVQPNPYCFQISVNNLA